MISRLTSASVSSTWCWTILPLRDGLGGMRFITPGRAVAIWDLELFVRIVAMTLPPKAGRVWSSRPTSPLRELSRMSRPVQSAVRPQPVRYDTIGASMRPCGVAAYSTICGTYLSTASAIALR